MDQSATTLRNLSHSFVWHEYSRFVRNCKLSFEGNLQLACSSFRIDPDGSELAWVHVLVEDQGEDKVLADVKGIDIVAQPFIEVERA